MRLILLFTVLSLWGCAGASPTAPTATPLPSAPVVLWSEIATGCSPRLPLPQLTADDKTTSQEELDNELIIVVQRADDTVFATFKRSGTVWRLCVWDTSDI